MSAYRSKTSTTDRNTVGAHSLWRATGVKDEDFQKPIIAVVNSLTRLVPGHVHLKDLGQFVMYETEAADGVVREFSMIAVDDSIAMSHDSMLYSLPSRDIIAGSVEYMVSAHCVDVMVCIPNCDKITPGILMVATRLNILVIFVSGGPMEANKTRLINSITKAAGIKKLDLTGAMMITADSKYSDEGVVEVERPARPICGSCSSMFTANSTNCLIEAPGLSLPGNDAAVTTYVGRKQLFGRVDRRIVELTHQYYEQEDERVLPCSVSFKAFENMIIFDIAVGGSTNTILRLLTIAQEVEIGFTMAGTDHLSRAMSRLCRVAPSINKYHIEDVHRIDGAVAILGELDRAGKPHTDTPTMHAPTLKDTLNQWDIVRTSDRAVQTFYRAGPVDIPTQIVFSQDTHWPSLGLDCAEGHIRSGKHAFSEEGDLTALRGNIALDGCVVRTVGIDESTLVFEGTACMTESQDETVANILADKIKAGDVVVACYEDPKGSPGIREVLCPTSYAKSKSLSKAYVLLTDGCFSGGTSGLSIGYCLPEVAAGGAIGPMRNDDKIHINIPNHTIDVLVSDEELAHRHEEQNAKGWKPAQPHPCRISAAFRVYIKLITSADRGAVCDLS